MLAVQNVNKFYAKKPKRCMLNLSGKTLYKKNCKDSQLINLGKHIQIFEEGLMFSFINRQ